MSHEEQRLLAAIAEAPDDDAPRLVYADWLQAQGDPRGEFIQLQCQLAAAPDDERRRAIKIAENKLLAAHGNAWLQPVRDVLPPANEYSPHKFEFSRGFVEEAHLTLSCVPHFEALWQRAPLIRALKLTPATFFETPIKQPKVDGLLDRPQFSRLRSLELSLGGGGNPVARAVAAASTLANLRELTLHVSVWGDGVGMFESSAKELVLDDAGITALARSPHLANLDTLLVDSNRITCAGVTAIAQGSWRLRRLDLAHNVLDATRLARSLAGPALERLEVLGLAGITFDAAAIAALVSSPALQHLRELDLERCHLGVAGIEALCAKLALPALRRLRLERNALCDKGALAIAGCAAMSRLTNLEAGHNRMGHKAAIALASSEHLANLERLTLNEPRWKPETAALFATSQTLANAKIYLQGRLVGRKKTSGAEAAVASSEPDAAKKQRTKKAPASSRPPRGKSPPKKP